MPRHALLACLLAAATAACSSPAPTQAVPEPASVEQQGDTTSAAADPSPPESGPETVGKTQVTKGTQGEFKVTVTRIRRPFKAVVAGLPERKAFEYAAADVRFCVKDQQLDEVRVGWSSWSMTTKDGTVVEALSAWSNDWWSQPLYPQDHVVKQGRCVRGMIPFEVERGAVLDVITYSPDEMDELEWKVRG
jgi:hypothetical protein